MLDIRFSGAYNVNIMRKRFCVPFAVLSAFPFRKEGKGDFAICRLKNGANFDYIGPVRSGKARCAFMQKEVLMTESGLKKYEAELEELKSVRRKEISEKIKVALSFGDLSENSEYDEAKNEQAIVEARISELEELLKNVKIIDEKELSTDIIHVGSRIVVWDKTFDEKVEYQIVGSKEANPLEDRISDESPVGQALLGHKIGDVVEVEAPGGAVSYEVLEIKK